MRPHTSTNQRHRELLTLWNVPAVCYPKPACDGFRNRQQERRCTFRRGETRLNSMLSDDQSK